MSVTDGQVTPRKNFDALAKQMDAVKAAGSNQSLPMNLYTPTNTARDCPAVAAGKWAAASVLPPTPNKAVCDCMVQSLECTMSSTVTAQSMGSLFGTVCGLDPKACDGIASNATTGAYGAFSMCSSDQQLSHVLNQYYVNQKKTATACDFKGQAKVLASAPTPAATCASVLAAAPSSSGVVPPSSGSGTGSTTGSGGSTSGSGSGSTGGTTDSGTTGGGKASASGAANSTSSGAAAASGAAGASGSGPALRLDMVSYLVGLVTLGAALVLL